MSEGDIYTYIYIYIYIYIDWDIYREAIKCKETNAAAAAT